MLGKMARVDYPLPQQSRIRPRASLSLFFYLTGESRSRELSLETGELW